MKKTITFTLLLLLVAAVTFAQSGTRTILKIRLSDRTPISVNLDGRFINQETVSLTLDGIRPGLHRIEVFSEGFRRRPLRIYIGTVRLLPSTVNVGVVNIYTRGLRLRSRPNDQGDVFLEEDRDGHQYPGNRREDSGSGDRRDEESGDEVYGNEHRTPISHNDESSRSIEGRSSFPRKRQNSDGKPYAARFSERDIDDLQSRVSAWITDSDKERLMKEALQGHSLATDQVRLMMAWFSFESTRLDFAKWAHAHVDDREDYWKLEDAFDFSASKKEFADAIRIR